jgi:hypothetical protein
LPDIRIALERCRDGAARRDVTDPAQGLESDCVQQIVDGSTCGDLGQFSLVPVTMIRCRIAVDGDASFRLRYVNPTNPLAPGQARPPNRIGPQSPNPVLPHVKVVAGSRVLIRGMSYAGENCTAPGPGGGTVACSAEQIAALRYWHICNQLLNARLPPRTICPPPELAGPPTGYRSVRASWRFAVGDPLLPGRPPSLLRETFGPGIDVDHIRFFTGNPSGERRYLRAEELRDIRLAGERCDILAEPGTGIARMEPARCPTRRTPINPAWGGIAPGDVLEWSAVFQADAQAQATIQVCRPGPRGRTCTNQTVRDVLTSDIAVHETDRLYVEFHLRG